MMKKVSLFIVILCIFHEIQAFVRINSILERRSASVSLDMAVEDLGNVRGQILVTGIGDVDEDEFMLSLLHEQDVWDSVILGYPDAGVVKKRFLSRTARYSGLLNVLDFTEMNIATKDSDPVLKETLQNSNAWIAFNLTQSDIPRLTKMALDSDVNRVIFTMYLSNENINTTSIPEFDDAIKAFESAGKAFTGIRHGDIIAGDEDNSYEISNSTVPCMDTMVERGVLARVVSELLYTPVAGNEVCGVSSSGSFAAAYLNILRSSGLNRRQEVTKMFTGGLQRVAQMTVNEYEAQAQRDQEAKEKKEARRVAKEEEEAKEKIAAKKASEAKANMLASSSEPYDGEETALSWDMEIAEPEATDAEKIEVRVQEILQNVWVEMDARMYARSTSKKEFFDVNREKAVELATREMGEEKERRKEIVEAKKAKQNMLSQMVDVNRKQYSKLLALERQEMENQKVISDAWVKYIYLLIESTLSNCEKDGVLFHNMDEFGQTMALREQANILRSKCGLESYDVIYDPLDASTIVGKMEKSEGLEDVDDVIEKLNSKHGNMLETVSALRGASQIIEMAIKTLRNELPPPPPTVDEMRRSESSSKQAAVSEMRLDALKKRGQPQADADSAVGRL